MPGIAEDMYNFILSILNPGKGVQDHIVTNGNAAQNIRILQTYDRVCPALTILNSSSSGTVTVGFGGNPTFPLLAGASVTLRYCNPYRRVLTINDGGTAATVDILG